MMPASIIVGTGVFMCLVSWRRWPDVFIDFGRELYTPWMLNNGAVLYRDIDYTNGPLAPHINALIFRMFGPGMMHLAVFNIVLIALLTLVIYRFFRETTDSLVSTAVSASFLGVFAFSQYTQSEGNYNFVAPYSHDLTHGVILSFVAIYLLLRFMKTRKRLLLIASGACSGIVFLTKVEVFVALAGAITVGMTTYALSASMPVRNLIQNLATHLGSAILSLCALTAMFLVLIPATHLFSGIFFQYKTVLNTPIATSPYYLICTGLDEPCENFIKMQLVGGAYLMMLGVLWAVGTAASKLESGARKIALAGAATIIAGTLLFINLRWLPLLDMARSLPLIMLALIIHLIMRVRNRPERRELLVPLLTMTVFAFLLLLKILLFTRFHHYGFALAMPAFLLAIMVLLYQMPALVASTENARYSIKLLALVVFAVVVASLMYHSEETLAAKNYPVGTGDDVILTEKLDLTADRRGEILNEAVEGLRYMTRNGETFVVLPQGIFLNYLLKSPSPIDHNTFFPCDYDMYGETHLLRDLQKGAPDYVVLVDMDTSELGCRYFGKEYGTATFSWIVKHYRPAQLFGNWPYSGKGFGVLIVEKNKNPIASATHDAEPLFDPSPAYN